MLKIWIGLVAVAAIALLWLGGRAGSDLWDYSRLNRLAPAQVHLWEVEKIDDSTYAIVASYTYRVKGEEYQGKYTFQQPSFLNRPSAESDSKKWQKLSWEAWYDGSEPSHSALQKFFPFKSVIRASLALIVLGYFYFLRRFSDTIFRETQ